MNFLLGNLLDRYDLMSVRERVLVLVAVLAVMAVVWDTVFSAPLDRERKQRLQQVEALRAEVSGLEESVGVLASKGVEDQNAALNDEIARISKELPELEARLAGATSGLIGAEEMTQVLRQLLKRAERLQVRALRTLDAAPVMADVQDTVAPTAGARIFKHGLEIELAGAYLDVLRFLQAMESLQWRFFWDQVELEVEQHPRTRVRLVVYTLSLEEGWIGV